jgi:hypothetical protein
MAQSDEVEDAGGAALARLRLSDENVEFGQEVLASFFAKAVATGEIDLKTLGIDDAVVEFLKLMRAAVDSEDFDFGIVIDHSGEILEEARRYRENERYEFAIVFYAMWIEHWANRIISDGSARHGLESRITLLFIRKLSIIEKLEMAWAVFGWDNFPAEDFRLITTISDARNAFVHYKWTMRPIDEDDDSARRACEKAELIIPRLSELEGRITFGTSESEVIEAFLSVIRARRAAHSAEG